MGSCFSAGGKLIKFPLVMESLSGWAQGWSAFVPAGPSASRLWLTQVKMYPKYILYSRFGRRYKNHKLCLSPQIPPPHTYSFESQSTKNLERRWNDADPNINKSSLSNLQATLPPSQSFLFQTESRPFAKPPTAPTQHLNGPASSLNEWPPH